MALNDTPRAERLHIGLMGRRNSGKSALMNALTGADTSLVSAVAGTTTDPVHKSIEIAGLGPCVLIDTAGYDDEGELGRDRVARSERAAGAMDVVLMLFDGAAGAPDFTEELRRAGMFAGRGVPVVGVVSKGDLSSAEGVERALRRAAPELPAVRVSARCGEGIDRLLEALRRAAPARDAQTILGDLVAPGDVVLLVMPQDAQAPRGRLILPQVQTLRELLDRGCTPVCCTPERMEATFAALREAPRLVVTDSQVFAAVHARTPAASRLTSFSMLMARYKGDIDYFVAGAAAVERLTPASRVLIAEACTHAPLSEDIGRVKIPAMLRRRVGEGLRIDIVAGSDFPDDLRPYDLVIHCGGCMFNRRHMLTRVERARSQGVPMTNYGVLIARLSGVLPHVVY